MSATLIVFGGLPGVGKSTIAREVARQLRAAYLRIDTIEQALKDAGTRPVTEGYVVGYAVATENLRLGGAVVTDSVNPLAITRDAWRSVAEQAGAALLEVEVVCSDLAEHRRRVETRTVDVAGLVLPSWENVEQRQYEPWVRPRFVVDTAVLNPEAAIATVMQVLKARQT